MRKMIIAFLLITFAAVGAQVQAASLYSLSDLMTRQAPSVASDHTITFKTPLPLISGQTISIEFAAGFNLSSITAADVSLNHGPSTGLENISALAASISGSILTVTNFGGSVSANEKIIVKIGQAAGGVNRIVNPSTTGTKVIRISLSNGASGSLAVPISNDSVGVSQGTPANAASGAESTIQPNLIIPTVEFNFISHDCPIFQTPYLTKGSRPTDVSVFINNSGDNFIYPTQTTWEKLLDYVMGLNVYDIFGIYPSGQRSTLATYQIFRSPVGDVNKDFKINDFDLAGLAWHWSENWCYADFNKDFKVNDFDLAGLAGHWTR